MYTHTYIYIYICIIGDANVRQRRAIATRCTPEHLSHGFDLYLSIYLSIYISLYIYIYIYIYEHIHMHGRCAD